MTLGLQELLRGSKNRGLEKSGFCFFLLFSVVGKAHALDYRSYFSCKNLASD